MPRRCLPNYGISMPDDAHPTMSPLTTGTTTKHQRDHEMTATVAQDEVRILSSAFFQQPRAVMNRRTATTVPG